MRNQFSIRSQTVREVKPCGRIVVVSVTKVWLTGSQLPIISPFIRYIDECHVRPSYWFTGLQRERRWLWTDRSRYDAVFFQYGISRSLSPQFSGKDIEQNRKLRKLNKTSGTGYENIAWIHTTDVQRRRNKSSVNAVQFRFDIRFRFLRIPQAHHYGCFTVFVDKTQTCNMSVVCIKITRKAFVCVLYKPRRAFYTCVEYILQVAHLTLAPNAISVSISTCNDKATDKTRC